MKSVGLNPSENLPENQEVNTDGFVSKDEEYQILLNQFICPSVISSSKNSALGLVELSPAIPGSPPHKPPEKFIKFTTLPVLLAVALFAFTFFGPEATDVLLNIQPSIDTGRFL